MIAAAAAEALAVIEAIYDSAADAAGQALDAEEAEALILGALTDAAQAESLTEMLRVIWSQVLPVVAAADYGELVQAYGGERTQPAVSAATVARSADPGADLWLQVVTAWLETEAAELVTSMGSTSRGEILEVFRRIAPGLVAEGKGMDEIARVLREEAHGLSVTRSLRIARTEVARAASKGSLAGAAEAESVVGALDKIWLATSGARTRPAHAEANGQRRRLDEPFDVGGEKLMHPADSSLGASASNTVQCRCAMYYEVRGAT